MKYQITFYFIEDPNKLINLLTIPAKDYGEAFSKFWDQMKGDVFILEINEETRL